MDDGETLGAMIAAMSALFCFCPSESLFALSPVMKCLSISDFGVFEDSYLNFT